MDYRKILIAYITWVGMQEGTDFLPISEGIDLGLSPEEMIALREASIDADPKPKAA